MKTLSECRVSRLLAQMNCPVCGSSLRALDRADGETIGEMTRYPDDLLAVEYECSSEFSAEEAEKDFEEQEGAAS